MTLVLTYYWNAGESPPAEVLQLRATFDENELVLFAQMSTIHRGPQRLISHAPFKVLGWSQSVPHPTLQVYAATFTLQ